MVIEAHIVVRELPHGVLDSFIMALIYGCEANELKPGESSADDKDSDGSTVMTSSRSRSGSTVNLPLTILQPAEIPVTTSRISGRNVSASASCAADYRTRNGQKRYCECEFSGSRRVT
jgi:hypothetical protein